MEKLLQSIDMLDLTLRTRHVLRAEGISIVYQLIQHSEGEMCRTPNLGKRGITEIKEQLDVCGLAFGTKPEIDIIISRPLVNRWHVLVAEFNGRRKIIGDGQPFTIDDCKILSGIEKTQKPEGKRDMIEQHLELLGSQMRDKVTDAKGMVESVTFDAYGCVQALLKCKVTADGRMPEQHWVDIKRLLPDGERIMPVPPHFTTPPGQEAGPADKPAFASLPKRDL